MMKKNSQHLSESEKLEEQDKVGKLYTEQSANESTLNEGPQLVNFIGNEPFFMISQASENLIKNLDDLFNIFDSFQAAFYSGETQTTMAEEKQEIDEDKAVYEESILITILGENYMEFIDQSTGEWVNEKEILTHFNKLFFNLIEEMLRSKKNT